MLDINIPIREKHSIGQATKEWLVHSGPCPALRMHSILSAGISHAGSDFGFTRLCPHIGQILACTAGHGAVWTPGQWMTLEQGYAYVTPPNSLHAHQAIAGERWDLAWVMYEPKRAGDKLFAVDAPTIVSGDFALLAAAIRYLYDEVMGEADATIMHNWSSLVNAYAQRCILPCRRLAGVWNAVRSDLTYRWSVADLAAMAGMSGEHLRRICVAETGLSPLRFVTQLRMREAAALISVGTYKLELVADRVGYDNVFAFSTAFKRYFGKAPADYRMTGKLR